MVVDVLDVLLDVLLDILRMTDEKSCVMEACPFVQAVHTDSASPRDHSRPMTFATSRTEIVQAARPYHVVVRSTTGDTFVQADHRSTTGGTFLVVVHRNDLSWHVVVVVVPSLHHFVTMNFVTDHDHRQRLTNLLVPDLVDHRVMTLVVQSSALLAPSLEADQLLTLRTTFQADVQQILGHWQAYL